MMKMQSQMYTPKSKCIYEKQNLNDNFATCDMVNISNQFV